MLLDSDEVRALLDASSSRQTDAINLISHERCRHVRGILFVVRHCAGPCPRPGRWGCVRPLIPRRIQRRCHSRGTSH